MLSKHLGPNWKPPPELPNEYNQIRTKKATWDELVTKKFQYGSPVTKLFNEFSCIHKFSFDEVEVLTDLLKVENIEYMKTLYKMELLSRFRIQRLLELFVEHGYHHYFNNLEDRHLRCVGVFFGSTGRFEASQTSDYEFLFIRKDVEFSNRSIKRDFTDELRKISEQVITELEQCPIFEGSHPCGTITDYGIKRSWEYMYNKRRPMLVAYLFSYCFFSNPDYLHTEMKRACLQNFGIKNIIQDRIKKMGVRKFKKIFTYSPDEEIQLSVKSLKDYGMDSIQSLSLLHLKENAGHSLIDDVLVMRKNNFINDYQTRAMIFSILELYRARNIRDQGENEIITTPKNLEGFKIAFDLLNTHVL